MFNNGTSGLSASDVLALTNNENGFGNGNSWIWLIVIIALFGGFGGYGFGGGQGGVRDAYILNSDFSTLSRQMSDGFNSVDNALDRQNAGICDLGYTQLSLANQLGTQVMQGNNAIQTQLADCCCTQRSEIKDVNYNVANVGANIVNKIQECLTKLFKTNDNLIAFA